MKKEEKENYIFCKRSLLVQLFLYYLKDIGYEDIILRSFGFEFDPTCNYKTIVTSKHKHIHKYVTHIFKSTSGVDFNQLDKMGNINFFKMRSIKNKDELYIPKKGLNIYFFGVQFYAIGYIEGKKIKYIYTQDTNQQFDDMLYDLNNDKKTQNVNCSASTFILWLLKLFTSKLNVDLILGAGVNADLGGKDWVSMMDSLNNDFYKGDYKFSTEIEHYVGKELFTSSMVLKTSGFDSYKSLNRELYEYQKDDLGFEKVNSTLSKVADYIQNHNHCSVITYNFDTNLEYILKKREVKYTVIYDDNSFANKGSQVDIYHVHGLLPYNRYNEKKYTDSLIFNESEYFYLYNNPYCWNITKQLHDFKFNVCLFIGISLTDPDMKRLLELANNYLKFNFIFLKKNDDYSQTTYKDLTAYFFTYDLIVIWVDDYSQINDYLAAI